VEEIISKEKLKNTEKLQTLLTNLLTELVTFKIAPKQLSEIEHSRIDTEYDECKQIILSKVIDQFHTFNLTPGQQLPEISTGKPIFSQPDINNTKKWFEKKAEELKEQAKTMKYFGFFKHVPWQMWIILLFFAYDDIMRMLFSPFWLTLLLFIGGSIFYLRKNDKSDVIFKFIKLFTDIIEKFKPILQGAVAVGSAVSQGKKDN
jgi:hypothetical protein